MLMVFLYSAHFYCNSVILKAYYVTKNPFKNLKFVGMQSKKP